MQAFICERHSFAIATMTPCLGSYDGQYAKTASVLMHGTFNRDVRALQNAYRISGEITRGEGVQLHLRAQLFMAASEASRIVVLRAQATVSGVQGSPRTTRTTSPSESEAYRSERSERPSFRQEAQSAGKAEHSDSKAVVQTKCAGEAEERRGRIVSVSDDVYGYPAKKRREHSERIRRELFKRSRRRTCESFCNDDFVGNDNRRSTKSRLQNISEGLMLDADLSVSGHLGNYLLIEILVSTS